MDAFVSTSTNFVQGVGEDCNTNFTNGNDDDDYHDDYHDLASL